MFKIYDIETSRYWDNIDALNLEEAVKEVERRFHNQCWEDRDSCETSVIVLWSEETGHTYYMAELPGWGYGGNSDSFTWYRCDLEDIEDHKLPKIKPNKDYILAGRY